jgi:hypothetical protein
VARKRKPKEADPLPQAMPMGFHDAHVKMEAAQPSQADIDSAMRGLEPTEVEVTRTRRDGSKMKMGTRRDYKKIKIRNADGSLNKYGKRLIELHEPAARLGKDIVPALNAGDLDDEPELPATERSWPLDPRVADRVARNRGLEQVTRRSRFLSDPQPPNLWRDGEGRLWRMAFVGTEAKRRVETYRA